MSEVVLGAVLAAVAVMGQSRLPGLVKQHMLQAMIAHSQVQGNGWVCLYFFQIQLLGTVCRWQHYLCEPVYQM